MTERVPESLFVELTDTERAALILDHAPDLTWLLDQTGCFVYAGPAHRRLLGECPETLIGVDMFTRVHPDDREQVRVAWERGTKSGAYQVTYRYRHIDGSWRWLETRANRVTRREGRFVVAVARDISDQKRGEADRALPLARAQAARAAAETAQQRLEFLTRANSILVASLDYEQTLVDLAQLAVPYLADLCTIYVVDQESLRLVAVAHPDQAITDLVSDIERRFPFTAGEDGGLAQVLRSHEPVIVPEANDAYLQEMSRSEEHLELMRTIGVSSALCLPLVARNRPLGLINFTMLAPSGRRYTHADMELAGELAHHAALVIDNTRLYKAELRARERAERSAEFTRRLQTVTAALLEAITPAQVAEIILQQGVAAMEADGGVLALLTPNGDALEVVDSVGYPERLIERYARMPIDAPVPLAETVRIGEPILIESRESVAARYPRYSLARLMREYNAWANAPLLIEGRVLGALDLSFLAPRTFSQDDQAFIATLAQQCAQALDRTRLYDAEKRARAEAEAAVRVRDQFLSVAAHELRTPLTALLGYAQLLARRTERSGALNERDQRTMQIIVDQTARLNRMITTLLDTSRMGLGQLQIERHPMDLRALVERLVEETRSTLVQHTLSLDIPADPLIIYGDEMRLEQALQNLMQNAIKYSPDGGPVHVSLTQRNTYAAIAVNDRGLGIPADALPNLFQRFFRAENVEAQNITGMGVGLYVVKEIVSHHGGVVDVVSEENVGSTFTLLLPMDEN